MLDKQGRLMTCTMYNINGVNISEQYTISDCTLINSTYSSYTTPIFLANGFYKFNINGSMSNVLTVYNQYKIVNNTLYWYNNGATLANQYDDLSGKGYITNSKSNATVQFNSSDITYRYIAIG